MPSLHNADVLCSDLGTCTDRSSHRTLEVMTGGSHRQRKKSTADSTRDSLFKGAELPKQDSSVIVQTRDFVIDSDDEAYLVPMETLDPKKKKEYEIPKVYDLPT